MSTELELADEKVARGAALLDARMPDWHRKVDLKRLDIEDNFDCVLGQVFKTFFRGFHLLGINDEKECRNLGFLTSDKEGEWYDIEFAWKKLIQERLELAGEG